MSVRLTGIKNQHQRYIRSSDLMTKISLYFSALSVSSLLLLCNGWTAEGPQQPGLIPLPAELTWQAGELPIDSTFTVALEGRKDSRLESAIQRWLERLAKRAKVPVSQAILDRPEQAKLVVHCDGEGQAIQSVLEDESYSLTITTHQARLAAPNPLGILRGLETLMQLVRSQGKGQVVPCVTIQDRPRFRWRGLLIDVARHWQPLEVVKRNLDGMAGVKLNVLHWHLTEDQGFRVESRRHPRLHQMGSDGLYYTQDQLREVVAYARDRGIRVVPEFDMPGHVTSWLVGHPELASAPGPYQIERTFGIKDPTFDPTRDEVYQFIDTFLAEMAQLFPDEYMHIGGDEVNGKQWNQNSKIREFMREHNLKNNQDLHAYFNSHLLQILAKQGKKMVGWDEILHPDLPRNIVVQSWRGPVALAEAAKRGYDGILSHGYYLDLIRTAAFHYHVDPIPSSSDLTTEQRARVLGGEAAMWTEYASSETIDSRIWPRNIAIAERFWSPANIQDVADMYRRLEVESIGLEEFGLTHRSNYAIMLRRLAGKYPVESLKALADVVEPVKLYARESARHYTSETPLNRLVDTARPESDTARLFGDAVDQLLKNGPRLSNPQKVQSTLTRWKNNDKKLRPILEQSELAAEAVPLSQDLSTIAKLGLEALKFLKSGKQAPISWPDEGRRILDRAREPRAEVEIAVIPGIRKLVLAAG